MITKYRLTVIN